MTAGEQWAASHPISDKDMADLTSHHIEGFTREGGHPFQINLYTQIEENLWMGGCPVGEVPDYFKHIVSLYQAERYVVKSHQGLIQYQLYDNHNVPDKKFLYSLAKCINALKSSGPVLVHCQAGPNRSGLLTALALMQEGKDARKAIDLLREKRCSAVLCNVAFENTLLDWYKDSLDWSEF